MSNLNEFTDTFADEKNAPPRWRAWLRGACHHAVTLGFTLFLLSTIDIVPPRLGRLGTIGLALAGTAAFVSYRLKRSAIFEPGDYVMLNEHLLSSKGGAYHNAINSFQSGETLIYDGIEFACPSKKEIVCRVVADRTSLDDNAVFEIAAHTQSVIESLRNKSAEFDSAINVRKPRIVIASGNDANAFELCTVVDGSIDWRIDEYANDPMRARR